MIDWREEGLVLATRRLGEHDAVVEGLFRARGRHAGLVRGGGGRRLSPLLQPGATLAFGWRARLEGHLGAFTVEPVRARAGLMADRSGLLGLGAVTALLLWALPEREAYPALFEATVALLDLMEAGGDWGGAYVAWEAGLLSQAGFGLDLSACAVTGATESLAFVSPRTGRAVSRAGAGDWADRLLPLPEGFARGRLEGDDLAQGLALTGHFLDRWLAPALERPVPQARARLAARLRGRSGSTGG